MAINFTDVANRQVELSYTPPQNFVMVIEKLPQVVFTCQQIQIPTISAGEALLSNRYNPSKTYIPGDGIDYSNVDVTFLIDKEFKGYRSILQWMKQNGAPESPSQHGDVYGNDFNKTMSNITIIGTNAANEPIIQWNFHDCFPVSLDGVQYDSTQPDIMYLTCSVSFRCHYFTHQTYTSGQLNPDLI